MARLQAAAAQIWEGHSPRACRESQADQDAGGAGRWVDEDEEEEKGDFDMSGLQNMQNYDMGGGGGGGGGGMVRPPPILTSNVASNTGLLGIHC